MANHHNRESETRENTQRKALWEPAQLLPAPNPQPGWAFRWIRTSIMGYLTLRMCLQNFVKVGSLARPKIIRKYHRNQIRILATKATLRLAVCCCARFHRSLWINAQHITNVQMTIKLMPSITALCKPTTPVCPSLVSANQVFRLVVAVNNQFNRSLSWLIRQFQHPTG